MPKVIVVPPRIDGASRARMYVIEDRHIIDRCDLGGSCVFTPADEFLPKCDRCGEAMRPMHDTAEVWYERAHETRVNDTRVCHVHAEPCATEMINDGWAIA